MLDDGRISVLIQIQSISEMLAVARMMFIHVGQVKVIKHCTGYDGHHCRSFQNGFATLCSILTDYGNRNSWLALTLTLAALKWPKWPWSHP